VVPGLIPSLKAFTDIFRDYCRRGLFPLYIVTIISFLSFDLFNFFGLRKIREKRVPFSDGRLPRASTLIFVNG
jgi:hypothetical protein